MSSSVKVTVKCKLYGRSLISADLLLLDECLIWVVLARIIVQHNKISSPVLLIGYLSEESENNT